MINNKEIAKEVAEKLLAVNAVSLQPQNPFTWASGMRSPIYCDNRITLAYPEIRSLLATSMAQIISEKFADIDVIAGTATAGIAHAALVAEKLGLPMAYVRSQAKTHGKGNQIEGKIAAGQKVIMIEDLISTGSSVLQAATAVCETGATVKATVAIFNYNIDKAKNNFAQFAGGTPLYTLCDFSTLINVAEEKNLISKIQLEQLSNWSENPQAWSENYCANNI